MSNGKIWLITGASRGFGRLWAEAALARGDKVVATARDIASLQGLIETHGDAVLALPLDVTDRAAVFAAVQRGHAHFGRLDVIVSNAGYRLMGAIEELDLDDVRAQFETNVFGTLSVIQAALPLLRAQGSGHILTVASIGGLVTRPSGGAYQATKFAVVALSETLAQEVAGFGIKVTIIEPGPFATDFAGVSLKRATALGVYEPLRQQRPPAGFDPSGFPAADLTTAHVLKVVDADQPPLHLLLGNVRPMIDGVYAARIADWNEWAGATG